MPEQFPPREHFPAVECCRRQHGRVRPIDRPPVANSMHRERDIFVTLIGMSEAVESIMRRNVYHPVRCCHKRYTRHGGITFPPV